MPLSSKLIFYSPKPLNISYNAALFIVVIMRLLP
jgi:hypothetical protein